MGLCKCERKRVTNLFCFEHRVNVCEFCIISSHPKCVVKSYLRWVKDSDFSPNCAICREKLDQPGKDCIRLLCLDVFHKECLNKLAQEAPPTVAPAGYLCPSCEHPVIPGANHGGPVAEALRAYLQETNWTDNDFSGPTEHWSLANSIPANNVQHVDSSTNPNAKLLDPHLDFVARQFLRGHDVQLTDIQRPSSSTFLTTAVSSPPVSQRRDVSVIHQGQFEQFNEENDKYRPHRKWNLFTYLLSSLRLTSILRMRRRSVYLLLIISGILLLMLLVNWNRSSSMDDSLSRMLDAHHDPNIHVDRQAFQALKNGFKLDDSRA